MIDLAKTTNTTPINNTPSVTASLQGNLQGRRVINTTEKIEELKTATMKIFNLGILTQGLGFGTFIGSAYHFGEAETYIQGVLWGCSMMVGGASYLFGRDLNKVIQQLYSELNDEEFIDWAETKKIDLTFKNFDSHHNRYLEEILDDIYIEQTLEKL